MAEMIGNGHCHSFNGDGRMDILARSVDGDLFVVPHTGELRGTRTFDEPVKIAENFHHLRDHYVVRTIDIDGSGRASVLALSSTKYNPVNGIFLYPNINGIGPLGPKMHISGGRKDRSWETMSIAPFGPGPDIMFGREADKGHVDAFYSRGEVREQETYDKTPHRMVTVDVADHPWSLADVTATGTPDLLVIRANGDLDVYEFGPAPEETPFAGEGTWHTVMHNWTAPVFAVTDLTGDGTPDLLSLHDDGILRAHLHTGKFNPEDPTATYAPEPEVVATGWQHYNSIS